MTTEEHTEMVQTRLSPALKVALRKLARAAGLSDAAYLRSLVINEVRMANQSRRYIVEDDE